MSRADGIGCENLAHQQVPVHGISDNGCDFRVLELDKSVALGPCSLLGAGDFDSEDFSVLSEVGFQLFLVESVREVSDVNDCILNDGSVTDGQVFLSELSGSSNC